MIHFTIVSFNLLFTCDRYINGEQNLYFIPPYFVYKETYVLRYLKWLYTDVCFVVF